MRTMLSALIVSMSSIWLPAPAHAASYHYAIDLTFPFEPISDSPLGIQGSYRAAGLFEIDTQLLPDDTITFVPYSRFEDFSLSLPVLSLGQGNMNRGTCSTQGFPLCGMLFFGTTPQSLVGQFVMPGLDDRFTFQLANTGGGFPNPDPLFQNVSIVDLDPRFGVTVASGFVAVRPVPEPSSMLLLSLGGILAGRAVRRSRAARGSSAP